MQCSKVNICSYTVPGRKSQNAWRRWREVKTSRKQRDECLTVMDRKEKKSCDIAAACKKYKIINTQYRKAELDCIIKKPSA